MKSYARWPLPLIAALLAFPFAGSTALYLSGWRPTSTVNHGTLISPPATLESPERWQGKWTLLLVHDGPCGLPCVERLDQLRRIRISLGQQMDRTRLVWTGNAIASEAAGLKSTMPDLGALDRRPYHLAKLPAGSVVLVDPNGLAMMRYLPGASPQGMRADLERLLKYVWSA